jgi:hypothetical protein
MSLLAGDIELLRMGIAAVGTEGPSAAVVFETRRGLEEALVRIRAALEALPHLEEAAILLEGAAANERQSTVVRAAYKRRLDYWLAAEAKRKGEPL